VAHLFESLKLRDIEIRNRIGVSPMCQYSSDDGVASDWHLVHLGSRAVGGAGLVMAEATAVEPIGRITPGCAGIWADKQVEPLARITRFLKEHGAVAGIQLAHAGRKASASRPWDGDALLSESEGGWEPIGPSPIPFGGKLTRAPREMTRDDIARVQRAFRDAAKRALAAGFQLVELHNAHGYLAHSFLSPISNRRTDEYGGSFENRIRFSIETVRGIRAVWPDNLPLAVRISASDWIDGGWTLEDSVELAKRFKAEGVDMVDCSSGALAPNVKYPAGSGWQVPLADAIRRGANIATAAVGIISEPTHADEIIRNGRADIVLLAREFLRSPYWPIQAAEKLRKRDALALPVQYRAFL
jgi:2,4-dienoyl-CoA reductase-like NADH-dependent reductase (Old Yellow Enzyme family)